jgi:hypothetical protein
MKENIFHSLHFFIIFTSKMGTKLLFFSNIGDIIEGNRMENQNISVGLSPYPIFPALVSAFHL